MSNGFARGTAVADARGRRLGGVIVPLREGLVRVRWSDGEEETIHRDLLLLRYTTQSVKF